MSLLQLRLVVALVDVGQKLRHDLVPVARRRTG